MADNSLEYKETLVPVLLHTNSYGHIMARVGYLIDNDHVELNLSLVVDGKDAEDLVAILTSGEPQGLQFVAIPVIPRKH